MKLELKRVAGLWEGSSVKSFEAFEISLKAYVLPPLQRKKKLQEINLKIVHERSIGTIVFIITARDGQLVVW